MLSAEQRDELATVGHLRLPHVVDRPTVAAMADRVWELLARRGIDQHDPSTWPTGFQTKLQGLRQARVFDPFGAVEPELTGRRPKTADPWGPALFTFPDRTAWLVPHRGWHLDLPGQGEPTEIRLFGYVTDVAPWGGGTLVVEGSHELVRRMVEASPKKDVGGSATIRRRLRKHPWFDALFQPGEHPAARIRRFMVDGEDIDGVPVRVAELTGNAGDVVVMAPWTLHSMSTNTAPRPRLMVTHTIHR